MRQVSEQASAQREHPVKNPTVVAASIAAAGVLVSAVLSWQVAQREASSSVEQTRLELSSASHAELVKAAEPYLAQLDTTLAKNTDENREALRALSAAVEVRAPSALSPCVQSVLKLLEFDAVTHTEGLWSLSGWELTEHFGEPTEEVNASLPTEQYTHVSAATTSQLSTTVNTLIQARRTMIVQSLQDEDGSLRCGNFELVRYEFKTELPDPWTPGGEGTEQTRPAGLGG